MKPEKKSLMLQLKWTVLALSAAIIAMWFLFYSYMHNMLRDYVVESMEQVSSKIISELNRSFLQLEEVSFALSEEKTVVQLMKAQDSIEFHNSTYAVEKVLSRFSMDTTFMDNIILCNEYGKFYRYSGSISNTGIQRMMNIINRADVTRSIKIRLDDSNYVGYVSDINSNDSDVGKIVMLTDEKDIYRLFGQLAGNEDMKIALAAGGKIIVSSEATMIGKEIKELIINNSYFVHKQVGFTPFELLVSYNDYNKEMSYLFFAAMITMAAILVIMLEVFLHFWKKKFFAPLQTVISQVESFKHGKGEVLSLTGMEHFDGLVSGINDMVERIEQQEKEVFEATYSMQEAEIRKQKAFIVSLKKQISAHFTVNVLNIIKALSATGENEKAGLMCDGLSFLLRYANAGDSYISGMDEFFVLEKYTGIMEIRYSNRFMVEIDMEDYLEEVELPRMLLQPIVENAILHGLSGTGEKENGRVHIYSILETDCFKIIVEDNGEGIEKEKLIALMEDILNANEEDAPVEGLSHVALINIQRRIASYFGGEYGILVESEKGKGTTVTVRLPILRRGF